MSNVFGISQSFENRTRSSFIPSYSGPSSPQVEAQAYRGYARRRSRIADQWLADAEGFVAAQAGEVAL